MRNKCEFLLISYFTVVIISGSAGSKCGNKGTGFQNPADGVCSNVDIRNDMEQFRKLENCTVVEGYLHISLIERAEHKDYEKWSFPELREITDHLMLYRVYGLKTLRHLFPNLTVIRGRELFNNYALVAYEMRDLEELGLVNLRTISRGGVRLTKSKKLCYIDTVDWARIGVDPVAQDFKDNKEESQCANYCPESCPSTKVGNVEAKRCWTSQHCQKGLNCKNCPVNQTCMDNGTCCHDYCLGGCTGLGPGDCFSCKGVVYQDKCQPQCPPHTYMFFERRCLTDKECLGLRNRTEYKGGSTKILRGEKGEPSMCVFTCPQNYTMREDGELKNSECVKCQGFCPKVCNGTDVNSIEDAQRLEHCSKIVGPLVIQIMGGSNVAQEMEKNLGNIKEVTGYLNVRRSYALLTLYFFKNLEIIGGENLQHQGHSLVVMDNSNLQELFPEEQMKKMQIKRGKVSFHSNRKLCYYKIMKFVNYLNLTQDPSEQDISQATNGDLKPCNEHHLRLNVTQIYYNSVILEWERDTQDSRQLLTYIINHKEIKNKNDNINIYQGRDACSDDVWNTVEVPPANAKIQMGVVAHLKAYTTYAVYVQSYTLSTAAHSAMTNVEVFTTNPYYPTEPIDLEVSSDDPGELRVKWSPPKSPNGNVTHYKVMYQKQALNINSFEQRDYCDDPISTPKVTTKDKEDEEEKKLNVTADCCACPKSKEELDAEVRKQEIEVYFENYLHSHVYCQRYDTLPEDILIQEYSLRGLSEITDLDLFEGRTESRAESRVESRTTNTSNAIHNNNINNKNKDVNDVLVPYNTAHTADKNSSDENSTAVNMGGGGSNLTETVQEVVVYGTEVVLPNLEHFTEYSIEVQACQETNTDKIVDSKLCSNRAITAGRTKANWTMDRINVSTISVETVKNSTGDVLIKWEPPPNPNGLILTYNLFYKRANQDNLVPTKVCINRRQFQRDSGYRLTRLEPGNWTFQINAISLAGNSSSTPEKFFIVPPPLDDEDSSKVFIAITAIAVLVLIVIVIIIVWVIAKNRFHKEDMSVISPNINYVPSEHMYIMDGWEVERDKIKLIKELGQGSFGMVYEGMAKGINDDPDEEIRVAVKTVNDRASFNDRREFLKEATTMKAFDCFHVVKLLGVVSTGQPALVIMELMALGDLKNYLREHRPDEQERPGVSPPKLLDILQMAGEIADGMAYLADKKFVHRDLAARNCMVAEDRTVKIGDFGMTRDIYETDYYRKGGKGMLPVRWMAPESLKDGVFTSMSDVWSYGVVMWEMVTLAAQPYQGLSNEEVVKYISDGSTMEMPDRCPMEMAYLMQRCWAKKPKSRPTFKEIIEYLLPHLNTRFEKVSYFFNDGGGPIGGGSSALGEPADGSDDASSINSLSCEGAAAPRLSLTGKDSGDYQFQGGSPHPSGGSASLYDDGMDAETYLGDDGEGTHYFPSGRDNFGDLNHFHPSPNGFTLDLDDSSQPFISEDLQAVPHVKTRQPSSLLSHEQNGNDSALRNSGLIELQPLISKDRGLSPPSPRLNNVQLSSNPLSSEYMVHQPPTLTTNDHKSPSGPQSLQQPNHAATDSYRSGQVSDNDSPDGAAAINPSRQSSSRPNAAKTAPSSVLARPTLRLPTLNQPPSGGFRRVPPYTSSSSGDNKNNFSSRTSQPSSSDNPYHFRTAPSPVSSNVVSMEEGGPIVGLSPTEETSPTSSSARHYSPPPGAITSSSDGSKESSKSSGSHSHINGLTNGHIPLSTVRHRTAPC